MIPYECEKFEFLNVASLNLSYRYYYYGGCSSEMAQIVFLRYSQGRSTCHSDRLHEFSVAIHHSYMLQGCQSQQFLSTHS